MIRDQRETALPTTGEGVTDDQPTTSLRQWSGLKDPRIVRVSRTFGGKDRHSKVRTIRGLRDRRVRLSVPTAIQLYDLQDRLGLNQPSKVVDWLLDAAQHEINKLPPLQLPPQSFNFPQSMAPLSVQITPPQAPLRPLSLFSSDANDENFGNQDAVSDLDFLQRYPLCWNSDALQRSKQKVVMREGNVINDHKEVGIHSEQFAAHQYPGSLISNGLSYASYYPCEQSNARGIHSSELEVPHCSTSQLLSLAPRSQLAFYHADGAPSISPPYMTTSSSFGMKELSHFPIGSFDSQHHSVELHHEKSP